MRKSPVAGIKDSPGESSTLTDPQIATWARQGGFTGDDLVIAIAVSLAEHNGNVVNDAIGGPNTDGTYDYGAWQINSIHKANFALYPDWYTVSNANQAMAVFNGQGWRAWSTYKDKKYEKFMDRARTAAGAPGTNTDVATPQNSWQIPGVNALLGLAQSVSKAGAWLGDQDNWKRVGLVVVGGGLVLAGVSIAAKPLTDGVAGALPVGKILKGGK
jgi:hypothetical protein